MAPRLDTPLARALLDAGKVDPSALEAAIQELLVHGGTLDTLLLEMGLVDEATLAQLLARAWDTQPVEPARIEDPSPDAVRALPERMAVAMGLCPFLVDDAGVHVLVSAPPDKTLLAEVGALLSRPLVMHVVPEVRLWQGLARAYGTAPEERFVSLLASVTGGARKVTPRVTDTPEADAALEAAPWDLVEALAHLASQDTRDGILHVAVRFARRALPFAALVGVRTARDHELRGATCHGWLRSGPAEGVAFMNAPLSLPESSALFTALNGPAPFVGRPDNNEGNATVFGWLGRRQARTFVAVPIVVSGRAVGALVGDGGVRAREVRALAELVSFGARLGPAFEALLLRKQRQHPSLFPIEAATAAPPDAPPEALAEAAGGAPIHAAPDASIASRAAPPAPPPLPARPAPRPITISMPAVEMPSRTTHDGTSPFARAYVAPERKETERNDAERADAGGPQTKRTETLELIAAAVEQAPRTATGTSLSDVLPQVVDAPAALVDKIRAPAALQTFAHLDDGSAPGAWRGALQTTVERGHQGGSIAAEERPKIFLDDGDWDDVVLDAAHARDLEGTRRAAVIALPSLVEQLSEAAPRATPALDEGSVRLQIAPPSQDEPSPRAIEELVDDLLALDDNTVRAAQRALLARGSAAVPALSQRFPGRLKTDPFDPAGSSPGPAQMGPLVHLLAELGTAGLEAAVAHLDSRYPAHRYCAVLLFAHTPDVRAIDLVRARLHDQEPRIQKLAADALAPFVSHPQFGSVLAHLRDRLQAPLVDARRRAAQLLGSFRDVGAVPTLISLLERPELAEPARQALRVITLQDHGARARGWERWWTRAKKRTRVDWLLDGLASDDRELRSVAALELSAMAGDDFGFHPDADRHARKKAEAAFQAWWDAARARPTG